MDDAMRSILKMLEEGRINVEEAERLFEELENSRKTTVNDKLKDIGKNFEEMAEDINDRLKDLNKEYGSKVKGTVEETGKRVVELLNSLSRETKKWFK